MKTIQWFPGHMAKTNRLIKEEKQKINCVIEMVDARCPLASRNPLLGELLAHKPRLIVLNKADLADPAITQQWIRYFTQHNHSVLANAIISGKLNAQLLTECKSLVLANQANQKQRTYEPIINILVAGVPNVGKSALINALIGKRQAIIGDRPGVTKKKAWITLEKGVRLLDTPGILWPKFEDPLTGYRLAISHAIKWSVLDIEDICLYAVGFLMERYPHSIEQRYGIKNGTDPIHTIERIALKRGLKSSHNDIDYERTYTMILRELQSGILGRISFETPT